MRLFSRDGYATPAATLISMAIAGVVIAGLARSSSEMRLARAELRRSQVEYALAGAHNVALLAIATSNRPPPYAWTIPSLGQAFDVVAEPERPKLSFQAVGALDDATLDRLGAGDREVLRSKLLALNGQGGLAWPADASSAPAWRACAATVISTYGAALTPPSLGYVEPQSGSLDTRWRAGEVWRIAVTDHDGWRDERIVRFTGNGLNPAAVIGRRLTRGWKDPLSCETLFVDA